MLDPKAVRHLGIDVGTTNTSLCYTSYNSGRAQFDLPTATRLGNSNFLRSALLLSETGQPVAFGQDVYQHPAYLQHPERVHEEFKLRLGETPVAEQHVTQLAAEVGRYARNFLQLKAFPDDKTVTTVGVPAAWARNEYHRVEAMLRAVAAAGLPNVGVVPEPVAAMLYHARLGEIDFEDHAQYWLVIDIGGGTTDLAIVETQPGGAVPVVRHTFGRTFGGRDFDQMLLEKLILAHYWPPDTPPPTSAEHLVLLQFIRQFKEHFSERMRLGQTRHSDHLLIHGRRERIELTRAAFESPEMAGPLIKRFRDLLREGLWESGRPLSDIDRVILTGGSARWYFVRETADAFFSRRVCLISATPELTIAQGLALAQTGFAMPLRQTAAPDIQPTAPPAPAINPDDIELTSVITQPLDLAHCRRQATDTIMKMAALAGGVALVLSPIPGVSQIPLTSIEAKMVMSIADIYGYKLDERQLVAVVGGLLAGGTVAKIAVMEVATFIPVIGTIVKTSVAGGAALGFGRLAIEYFEKRRRAEQGGDG